MGVNKPGNSPSLREMNSASTIALKAMWSDVVNDPCNPCRVYTEKASRKKREGVDVQWVDKATIKGFQETAHCQEVTAIDWLVGYNLL